MKKNNILIIVLVALLFTSCYKDDSTANYKILNPIMIEDTKSSFEIYSLDTLEITPMVYREGGRDEDLSFKWTVRHQLIVPTLIDTTMSLKIEFPFSAHNNDYDIIYEVTDRTTGISVEKRYKVSVKSPYGIGLLVGHSEDGIKSDVTLVRGYNYEYRFQDTIMANVYSRMNGTKLDGLITCFNSVQYGVFATLTIGTPECIVRVDPRDFKFIDGNDEIFIFKPAPKINAKALLYDSSSAYDILNNDGNIYVRNYQNGNRYFSYKALTPDMTPSYITHAYRPYWNTTLVFDEIGGRFMTLNTGSQRFDFLKKTDEDVFAWNEFQNYECLGMTYGPDKNILCVMKDKATKEIEVFCFKEEYSAADIRAVRKMKLPPGVCPELDKATIFSASEKGKILYYSTTNKIYAINYTIPDNLLVTEEYTVAAGEEITTMSVFSEYKGNGGKIKFTNPNPNADQKVLEVASQHRMLVVSTYNASLKKGYVNHVAIVSVSTGEIEKNRELHNIFGDFGKISAVCYKAQ